MGLFSRLRASIGQSRKDAWREEHRRFAAALSEVRTQVQRLDTQFWTIHMALSRHEEAITECKNLTDQHSKTLMQLEQLVSSPPAQPGRCIDRSVGTTTGAPVGKLDIDQFSEQQKRLLAVFFQNRDREMSYADVATVLGKSACTVKNQMNQIRQKADLFDCVIGPQSRHFFRLKDDLKVERLLKAGRPLGRPVSMAGSDPSGDEHMTAPTEHALWHPQP